jgi:hypothetical protein
MLKRRNSGKMKGPVKKRGAITEFKNIRVLPSGFQVTIVRGKIEVSKHLAGHSERSYRLALRCRDQLLRELPDKRLNKIPRRVLRALGLTKPVVGVFRSRKRKFYQVAYRESGRQRCRTFFWTGDDEPEAYRRAIEFRKRTISHASRLAAVFMIDSNGRRFTPGSRKAPRHVHRG